MSSNGIPDFALMLQLSSGGISCAAATVNCSSCTPDVSGIPYVHHRLANRHT